MFVLGLLAVALAAPLTLSAAPWTGPELPGSLEQTVKYRISVSAAPGSAVVLHASGLPKDWVGSWCTERVCQPTQTRVVVPPSGTESVEFQIVPDDPKHAALHPHVRIEARAQTTVSVSVRG